ncbi:MAG TPA: ATP-binding cassette domain-containing protein [Mycobacteriales bacterium]|nr:ATP-binding cassette domain-containing protein [Mycobacteriales bacterium]HVU62026.1 ATP-binding cassette domain-containing protein [Mycobacteriales bacterium]
MARSNQRDDAIIAEGVHKAFGKVRALDGIDLQVPRGSVLGVLGPNGAGKTTAVKILTTLLTPDAGRVVVDGRDVLKDPAGVRSRIGLAGQSAAIVEEFSGRENLELIGRLYHMNAKESRDRATELLESFGLTDAKERRAKTYSGGMMRRLDLAASLVAKPSVLFLDEPTTGLDPRARSDMWGVIRELVAAQTTVLLTTQYLEEADELADNIVVFDHGRVIAEGTADDLKDTIGGDVVEFTVTDPRKLTSAVRAVTGCGEGDPEVDKDKAEVTVRAGRHGSAVLLEVVRQLDAKRIKVTGLGVRRPSLDDVFLALTGHRAEEEQATEREAREAAGE